MKEFFIRRHQPGTDPGDQRQTIIRVNQNSEIVSADQYCESVLGYDVGELAGNPVQIILAARQDDPFAPAYRHQLDNGQTVLLTFRHKDGFFFAGHLGLCLETSERSANRQSLIRQRDHLPVDFRLFKNAEKSAGFGTWELDLNSNVLTWSDGMYQILELRPGCQLTPDQALFYCQDSESRVQAMIRRCIRTGQPFQVSFEMATDKQRVRTVELTGRAFKEGNRIVRVGGTLVDHTSEQQLSGLCKNAEHLLGTTINATSDLVVAVDCELNLLMFNQSFSERFHQIFRTRPKPGDNVSDLLRDFPNQRKLTERLWQRAFERDSFVVELPITHENESLPLYEIHYQRLTDGDGETIGAVHVARDISYKAQDAGASDRLQNDPITGLLNRKAFRQRLKRSLENKHRREGDDSLLYFDLDDFEAFNQAAGSGVGDRYLRELASNLGIKIRQRDALARFSGNSFALLIENCPEARAREIAEDTLELIAGFTFHWQDQQLKTTASGGLLFLQNCAPDEVDDLLSQAAELCHSAKSAGRNRLHAAPARHKTDIGEHNASEILEKLEKALDQHQLDLHFQSLKPVASATWGDHIEILARLPGTASAIKPDQFLPVAARFDLSKRLDRQVIQQTLDWLSKHTLLEPRVKYCGFNLSLASILDETFADFVGQKLKGSRFAPEVFCFDIREEYASRHPDEVSLLCEALHALGCRVGLEGAGASVESFGMTAKLPVDIIKIDHKIMDHLNDDPVQQIMVEAVHRIAEAAGKSTVATFIENDDTLRRVRALGIHFGQGFQISKPRPLNELKPAEVTLSTGRIGG